MKYQLHHILPVARGIRLGYLRIQRRHEVCDEACNGAVHLHGDSTSRIDGRTMKEIDDDVAALVTQYCRRRSNEVPPCEAEHLLQDVLVPMEMVSAFHKVLLAVMTIDETDNDTNSTQENGIEYQPVNGRNHNQECYRQLAHSLQDADVSKGGHFLMGYDGGIIRNANQTYDKADDGELQYPVCRRHSTLWYVHLGIQEPYAHRFYQ